MVDVFLFIKKKIDCFVNSLQRLTPEKLGSEDNRNVQELYIQFITNELIGLEMKTVI